MNYQMIYANPSWPYPKKKSQQMKKDPEQESHFNNPAEEERAKSRQAIYDTSKPEDHRLIFPEDEDSDDD